MRYLILSADYSGNYLVDEFDPEMSLDSLNLSEALLLKLQKWNDEYISIIPTSGEEVVSLLGDYEFFDKRAIALAQELIRIIPGGAKIKYYSEGKSVFLQLS